MTPGGRARRDDRVPIAAAGDALRQIVAAAVGNALEWYDFAVYGYFAVTISTLFFPPEREWTALLATFGLFAVAYVVRLVAGIVLGHYADRFGRKAVLPFIMALMAVGSALIALAPTYRTIGAAAPIVILAARLLQGISAGGEFSSATAFLVEHAPPRLRGFYGAWQFSGQGAAVLLSGIVGLLVTRSLSGDQLQAWGWRVPFALGAVVGPVGFYIRLRLSETPAFLRAQAEKTDEEVSGFRALAALQRCIWVALGLVLGGTAAFYVLFVFLPTYAVKILDLGVGASLVAPVVAGSVITVLCPPMGYLSDRVGRWRMMGVAIVAFLVAVYPAFLWLRHAPGVTVLAIIEGGFGILFAAYAAPFSAAIAELFPVRARATAMAAAYNVGVALFGGGAPLIVTWLIAATGDPIAPAYYVAAGLLLSLASIAAMPRRLAGESPESGVPGDMVPRRRRQDRNRRQAHRP